MMTASPLLRLLLLSFAAAHGTGATMEGSEATMDIFLGNGCFWGRQRLYVELEQTSEVFGPRNASSISSRGGYAGGHRAPAGRLCYYNAKNESEYDTSGAAEVVQISVSGSAQMGAVFNVFFNSFVLVHPTQLPHRTARHARTHTGPCCST